HVGDGARAVVGQAVDDHCRTVDAVAFVTDLLVARVVGAARAALDRALDRVLRHVVVHRLVDREPQPRIGRGIDAAELRRDGDFADQPREDLAALGIGGSLLVLYVRPLAVACHDAFPRCCQSAKYSSGHAANDRRATQATPTADPAA